MSAPYSIADEAPLRQRNTFRVAATARHLATLHDVTALPSLLDDERLQQQGPLLVLGEGSNVLLACGRYEGTILQLACAGVRIVEDRGDTALVRAEAALRWDPFVDWTLARGLCGLENLALIPGYCGAAPIQNIGAYGVEIAESIVTVEAYDLVDGRSVRLPKDACAFGYRDSRFKHEPDRWIVTAIELQLGRSVAREPALCRRRGRTGRHGRCARHGEQCRRRRAPDPSTQAAGPCRDR